MCRLPNHLGEASVDSRRELESLLDVVNIEHTHVCPKALSSPGRGPVVFVGPVPGCHENERRGPRIAPQRILGTRPVVVVRLGPEVHACTQLPDGESLRHKRRRPGCAGHAVVSRSTRAFRGAHLQLRDLIVVPVDQTANQPGKLGSCLHPVCPSDDVSPVCQVRPAAAIAVHNCQPRAESSTRALARVPVAIMGA